jgi:hypothetical protein
MAIESLLPAGARAAVKGYGRPGVVVALSGLLVLCFFLFGFGLHFERYVLREGVTYRVVSTGISPLVCGLKNILKSEGGIKAERDFPGQHIIGESLEGFTDRVVRWDSLLGLGRNYEFPLLNGWDLVSVRRMDPIQPYEFGFHGASAAVVSEDDRHSCVLRKDTFAFGNEPIQMDVSGFRQVKRSPCHLNAVLRRVSGPNGSEQREESNRGLDTSKVAEYPGKVSDVFLRRDVPVLAILLALGGFGAWLGSHDRYVDRWLGIGLIIAASLGISGIAGGWL